MIFSARQRIILLLLLLTLTVPCEVLGHYFNTGAGGSGHHNNQHNNPYRVLGVDRDASHDEIRRRYRELCLKYHPDKNVQCSETERKKREERFKNVQRANSQIGDANARRRYDRFGSSSGSGDGGFGTTGPSVFTTNPAFRRTFVRTNHPFFGFSVHDFFASRYDAASASAAAANQGGGVGVSSRSPPHSDRFKAVFVQKVQFSLEDLYSGKPDAKFALRDRWWERYLAAFRGGVAYLNLYQSFVYASPLLRISRWAALVVGLVLFHIHLPRPPVEREYRAELKAGYKEGTRLTFASADQDVDVVFILAESRHRRYRRVGNDLHVTVPISPGEARGGTVLELDALDASSRVEPLQIEVPAGTVRESGHSMRVQGHGWPIRRKSSPGRDGVAGSGAGRRGDLVVHFQIVNEEDERTAPWKRRSRRRVPKKRRQRRRHC